MKTRAITAFFFVIVMVASFLFGPEVFFGFYGLLSLACLFEFYGMLKSSDSGVKPNLGFSLLGAAILYSVNYPLLHEGFLPNSPLLLVLLTASILIVELFRNQEKPFLHIGGQILGYVYVILPFICFAMLAFMGPSFNIAIPLGFFVFLWTNDTAAYMVGRFFGRNKLFERISPKKTWEGFFGGVFFAVFAAWIFSQYFSELSPTIWMIMAALVGITGTLGDLVESMLKRSLGLKDSGNLLPGHGGLLDRFDGLLIAAPVVYTFLNLLN